MTEGKEDLRLALQIDSDNSLKYSCTPFPGKVCASKQVKQKKLNSKPLAINHLTGHVNFH